jgi:hypothetical protein
MASTHPPEQRSLDRLSIEVIAGQLQLEHHQATAASNARPMCFSRP